MLVKKLPSLYRRRRALVLISSLFGRMVTERIARFAQLDTKARPEFFTYRLRLLPNRHFGAQPVTTPPPFTRTSDNCFLSWRVNHHSLSVCSWRNDKVTLTQL
jgi:hypothetical protein